MMARTYRVIGYQLLLADSKLCVYSLARMARQLFRAPADGGAE